MRESVLFAIPVMLWVFAGMHAIFIGLFFSEFKSSRNILFLLSGIVTVGLFIDALILSSGTFLTEGVLLKCLSRFKFISHALLIPFIILICAYALNLKGLVIKIIWGLTGIVSILGTVNGVMEMLEPDNIAGVTIYSMSSTFYNVINICAVVILVIVGVIRIFRQRTVTLLLSGVLMAVFGLLGQLTGNEDISFFISMIGEIFMSFFLLMYARRTESRSAK